jgi:hypothetical protein
MSYAAERPKVHTKMFDYQEEPEKHYTNMERALFSRISSVSLE